MSDFIKSIFAGIAIGLAGCIYLAVPIQWVGAILFSVGLILVFMFNFNLYTGKIGYVNSPKELPKILLMIVGNCIGAALVAFVSPYSATALVAAKLTGWDPLMTCLKSIGCGYLIYSAVEIKRCTKSSFVGPLLCVPTFILCGFEHSIADMFYFFTAHCFSLDAIMFIIIVILGNAIGANAGRYMHDLMKLGQ